ncbi:MAG: hypothetical protein NVSMB57_12250 [Actinomycetota bacterium]
MTFRRARSIAVLGAAIAALALVAPAHASSAGAHGMEVNRAPRGYGKPSGGGSTNLSYHGGTGGIGVETAPKIYLVTWGWTSDPSGELPYLQNFYSGVGGSSWNNSVTQYCQNVPTGTINCAGISGAQFAGNPANFYAGLWQDTSTPPSQPTQSQLAGEATRAAAYFGNTTSSSNASVQYVVATATGKSSSGFGTQYCAWHSSTSSTYGTIAYTNLPYMTDAGASCGQNFVNSGSAGTLDGVSIVGGHELAETETDQFPNGGWLDSNGKENGDKCAWISSGQGASQNITLSTGTFAVQSLWSNAFNSGAGGCVISY